MSQDSLPPDRIAGLVGWVVQAGLPDYVVQAGLPDYIGQAGQSGGRENLGSIGHQAS